MPKHIKTRVFKFLHPIFGDFIGYQSQLAEKFMLTRGQVSHLTTFRCKSANGWKVDWVETHVLDETDFDDIKFTYDPP